MNIAGFTIDNLFSWLLLGLVAGIIVHFIDRSRVKGGILGTIITGILGALIGGFLSSNLLHINVTGFNIQSIIIAVIGALILGFIQRLLFRDNSHIKTDIRNMS